MKRTPPWTPHLNPIEYCIHVWKGEIKRAHKTTTASLRLQIDTASRNITAALVDNCLNHVFKYYSKCIAMEDLIQFDPDTSSPVV